MAAANRQAGGPPSTHHAASRSVTRQTVSGRVRSEGEWGGGGRISEFGVTMPVLLSAEGVTVRFGRLVAVRDIGFELAGGQLLGLIGPNGAGKTTLLRALAGLQRMAEGRVQVMGQRLDPLETGWSARRHLGFAPDNPPMYPELTIEQFLRFIGRAYDMPAAETEEAIDFWLDQLWLSERRRSVIRTLSRGMRQRVTIARSLLPNPKVILLDEPAGGLDPAGRVQFRQLLAALRDQGKALIVSSHILADLHEYCTHIAIMEQGRFRRYGSVSEITEGGGSRCRYRITLTRPSLDLERLLHARTGVANLEVNGAQAVFEFDEDRAAAAALLRALVLAGAEVASMAPLARDLEEAYLRTGIRQVD